MSAFRLKALGTGPGFVLAARADGKSGRTITMSVAAFEAHNAEARALEQAAAARAKNKQILRDCEQYIKDREAERRRREEQRAADEAERKRQAKQAAKRRKENAMYWATLRRFEAMRISASIGRASVAAPVAVPEPVEQVPSRQEVASLADAERLARIALEETLPRYTAIMYVDNDVVETAKPFRIATKQTLKLT